MIVPMNRREICLMAARLVHAVVADTKPSTEMVEVFLAGIEKMLCF
jgi:hypothetical protein